ncbi:PaaI family thioesterase [Deinococcus sp. RM]|uniref:PaaI family thioesterase n=1 Tax=Deinococcus sp. RM TaxID=2316359 RepID=UPI000E68351C|nr:PaaI family thioesterase [Deinococcus sp. RM]RIY05019.1 PaaI family thioesterase [Deinococcus sp. RM]
MTLHPDLKFPTAHELDTLSPEELAGRMNALSGTLGARLGIEFTAVSRDRVAARMPVDGNRQPAGRLHGGANLALAEELASVGSWMNLDPARQVAVGVDLSGTHVRGVTDGWVTGEGVLAYRGRTVLVWSIEIRDERGRVTSMARCTCNVIATGA